MAVIFPRPRIRRATYLQILVRDPIRGWSCEGAGLLTFGVLPHTAYEKWKDELLERAQERRAANPERKTPAQVLSHWERLIARMKGANGG